MGMIQIILTLENQVPTELVFDSCAEHLLWASLGHIHPWLGQGIAYNVAIELPLGCLDLYSVTIQLCYTEFPLPNTS